MMQNINVTTKLYEYYCKLHFQAITIRIGRYYLDQVYFLLLGENVILPCQLCNLQENGKIPIFGSCLQIKLQQHNGYKKHVILSFQLYCAGKCFPLQSNSHSTYVNCCKHNGTYLLQQTLLIWSPTGKYCVSVTMLYKPIMLQMDSSSYHSHHHHHRLH